MQLRVFESEAAESPLTNETIDVDVCYMHVNQTWPIAVCTEPMYGFKKGSKLWHGNTAYNVRGANATRHSLLDEFVVAHAIQASPPPILSSPPLSSPHP